MSVVLFFKVLQLKLLLMKYLGISRLVFLGLDERHIGPGSRRLFRRIWQSDSPLDQPQAAV